MINKRSPLRCIIVKMLKNRQNLESSREKLLLTHTSPSWEYRLSSRKCQDGQRAVMLKFISLVSVLKRWWGCRILPLDMKIPVFAISLNLYWLSSLGKPSHKIQSKKKKKNWSGWSSLKKCSCVITGYCHFPAHGAWDERAPAGDESQYKEAAVSTTKPPAMRPRTQVQPVGVTTSENFR